MLDDSSAPPVGARLAREGIAAVCLNIRVIVLRGQASLLQGARCVRIRFSERDLPVNSVYRIYRPRKTTP